MLRQLLGLAALLFPVGLAGQAAPQFTSPQGYVSKAAGNRHYNYALAWWDGRVQHLEENMPQKKTVLLRLDFRSNAGVKYSNDGCPFTCGATRFGKTYTNVHLTFADAAAKMTTVFSQNYLAKGSVVFNAKFSTPDLAVGLNKQVWGNMASIPLRPYVFNGGKNGLLMDWSVASGKLSNGFNGGAGLARYHDGPKPAKDSEFFATGLLNPKYAFYIPSGPVTGAGRCSDSGQTLSVADFHAGISAYLFADSYFVRQHRGKLQIGHHDCYYGAKYGTHIGVLSLGGSDQGVGVGAKCNKLHVQMATPLLIATKKADKFGHTVNYIPRSTLITFQDAWVGAVLMWQCGFTDTRTSQLVLSKAAKIILPKKPVSWKWATTVMRYRFGTRWYPTATTVGNKLTGALYTSVMGWNRK